MNVHLVIALQDHGSVHPLGQALCRLSQKSCTPTMIKM
jgi:hypothetical protein